MEGRVSRRKFIQKGVQAAAIFTIVPRHVLGQGQTPPSEMLTKAVIGVGGMGRGHINMADTKCLAVCDVDATHLEAALEIAGKDCKGYRDFREVLTRDDIDIIHVPTPPHWHALISIAAAQAGKDIWCEKPMTRSIAEGPHVIDAVHRNGRVFRINTGGRFGGCADFGSCKDLKKLLAHRVLGWPVTVRATSALGYNWKVKEWSGMTHLRAIDVPKQLDYNFWLGPAPEKPYHPHRVHGSFRGYWDYDGGGLADMGQHYLDPVQYILGKDDTSPVEVEAYAAWPAHPDAVQMWGRVELTYADGCKIILESGEWGEAKERDNKAFIEGPMGKLYSGFRTDPPELAQAINELPDPEPMIDDFLASVRTRKPFGLNEMNAFRSCILMHLSNIAIRTGRKLKFDPVALRFIDDDEANRLVNVPMRAPWHLPGRV